MLRNENCSEGTQRGATPTNATKKNLPATITTTTTAPLPLQIGAFTVKQDSQGRYCLNDLHKAAGGEDKDRPATWLRNAQTEALIARLSIGGILPILKKQGLGTFVAKELVYAYAMWISPDFYLDVIHTYDALVTGQIPGTAALPGNATLLLAEAAERQEKMAEEIESLQLAKVELLAPEMALVPW